MQHYYGLQQAQLEQSSVVTIGVFDGVHRGHQYLIRKLVEEARAQGKLAVALTFFPHPDVVLRKLSGRYYLTTPDERARLLGELGVDHVITETFDDTFRQTRAQAYVDLLTKHLRLSSLWVGSDFALGYQREGNVDFLRRAGQTSGFTVEAIDLLLANGDHSAISSTGIREALQMGDLDHANGWLGRAFSVTGEVVHGQQRGRTIGFPTANVAVWSEQVLPANGVYAGWARLGSERFMAVTNVGSRPTFAGQDITVEAYLLDFDRDIYGQQMTVTFEERLRGEQKFDGIAALIAQIQQDVEAGRAHLMKNISP
ncbi:MAG: bifunctional riboflavin kinase/FAD synthetase [Chloroflexota bacterium]|nr:bifunctional riboflavin kinase/FAD synthetase [Chloroflexota bacterium]